MMTTASSPAPPITKRLLTVEEFYRMGDAGIFIEGEHVELLEGELVTMAPMGPSHAFVVDSLSRILVPQVSQAKWVQIKGPLLLSPKSYFEPDAAIFHRALKSIDDPLPQPPDIALIIEVADSSLAYDRDVKMPLYAKHGIPEAWLIDIRARTLTAFREPRPEGYASQRIHRPGESVTPLHVPELTLDPAELFGK